MFGHKEIIKQMKAKSELVMSIWRVSQLLFLRLVLLLQTFERNEAINQLN